MATLINNIAALKANFSGLDANFNWASIQSFVEDVERDIIAETIGDDQLGFFAAHPTSGGSAYPKAIQLTTRAEAYISILKWSQTALFRLTDKSLYVAKSSDGVVISDKKLRDLRNYCEETGFNYLDKAIGVMEANLDQFAGYAASAIRQTLLQGFITTAIDFSYQRSIDNSRLTFMSVAGMMLDAQREYLPDVMGPAYYSEFYAKYLGETLSADEKKLLPYIKKAVAHLTMAKACMELPVKVGAKGLLINRYNDTREYDQADPADASRAKFLAEDEQEKGDRALITLKNYLVANAASYPDFIAPVNEVITPNDCHSGLFLL